MRASGKARDDACGDVGRSHAGRRERHQKLSYINYLIYLIKVYPKSAQGDAAQQVFLRCEKTARRKFARRCAIVPSPQSLGEQAASPWAHSASSRPAVPGVRSRGWGAPLPEARETAGGAVPLFPVHAQGLPDGRSSHSRVPAENQSRGPQGPGWRCDISFGFLPH